jgi:hypothetical protein
MGRILRLEREKSYGNNGKKTGVQPESDKEPEILDGIANTVRPFFKEHVVSLSRLGDSVNKVKQKQAGEHWEVRGNKWVRVP